MFFNREKELEELERLTRNEPNLITFVYGPINSGKTSLMLKFTKRVKREHVPFYINLRRSPVASYDDFLEILFSIDFEDRVNVSEITSLAVSMAGELFGIPIPRDILEKIRKEKRPKNAFEYVARVLEGVKRKGKMPILILDELQVIKDLKVNGPLIYELFNFFIHLTKEVHLAHVFVVTSDSLFIEKVYNETMLQGRSRYFLVDDFDKKTTIEFLTMNGFTKEEGELVWSYIGGKPALLVEAVNNREKLKEWLETILRLSTYRVKALLKEKEEYREVLEKFIEEEEMPFEGYIEEEIRELIQANILFLDPLKGVIRPQGRLELLAIREALR
ncbi:ATP-binding protein [Thermococcus chitonophagus]|uniref:ATP-binding protein n=1 Tax=Thermococcus chitonophagus TaxID=54262 RepID=A0A160VT63_9EURY|nr:ATP-binding protein [Thermococcus chitonophagus]ASJ17444.1 ATP-binding protein [Thermococcus chitonophagus]CUX78090.1 atp-binding protein [Thermococcus chitonophagus]